MGLMSMGLLGLIHELLQRLGLGLRSLGLRSLGLGHGAGAAKLINQLLDLSFVHLDSRLAVFDLYWTS